MKKQKAPKQFVISHAVTKDTLGMRIDGGSAERFTLKHSKDNPNKAKAEFIAGLNPGDQIYMEAGSGAERFALGCVRAGAEVFRLPTYKVHDELKTRANGAGTDVEPSDEELEEKNIAKRVVALGILRDFALNTPDTYYPFLEMDQKLAQVAVLANAYAMVQDKIRKPAVQRLRASIADLDIVEPIGEVDVLMAIQENMAETLFGPVRGMTKEKKNKKGEVVKPAHKETFVDILERSLTAVEDKLQQRIEQAFIEIPLYDGMFKHIPGCGPITSAKLIAEIKDIRFFDSEAKLVEAAGYGFLPDGSRKRKVRLSSDAGRALKRILQELFPDWTTIQLNDAIRMNWRPGLKQAVFLFTSQIRTYGDVKKGDNPWKQAYLHRLAYEKARQEQFAPKPDGTTSYPADRAQRWLGKIFLQHIWRAWRRFDAGGEYRPYDFECLRG